MSCLLSCGPAYLNCQVEEVHIPLVSGDDIFVHHGHTDGRQTIGENGYQRIILDMGKGGGDIVMGMGSRWSRRNHEGFFLLAIP